MSEENKRPESIDLAKGEIEDQPGLREDTRSITNDPMRQQVENNANQRSTEEPRDSTAAGPPFVAGQAYRYKGEPRPSVPPEEVNDVIRKAGLHD